MSNPRWPEYLAGAVCIASFLLAWAMHRMTRRRP